MKTFIRISLLCIFFTTFSIFAQGGGNVLDFDGSNDYVTVGTGPEFETNYLTVTAWVKCDNIDGWQHMVTKRSNGTPANTYFQWSLQTDDNHDTYHFGVNVDNDAHWTNSGVAVNSNWVHLTGTYDGETVKIYVNGILKNENTNPSGNISSIPTMNIYMGVRTTGLSAPYIGDLLDGKLDEVSIWSIACTQAQIQTMMYKGLSGSETGLVGYWKLNESSGSTAGDETAFNNDATLNNMNDADWISSTAPYSTGVTSSKTDVNGVWINEASTSSSILTLEDNVTGTDVVLFGHDNGDLTPNASDVPGGINNRLNRVWRMESYGTLNGNYIFNTSGLSVGDGSGLRMLEDADGTFSNASAISGTYSSGNNTFTVSGRDFINGNYYTLASATTPLPVELTLFSAKQNEEGILLKWETATEVNNYGFELERQQSENRTPNSEWETIGFVQGHGNSNSPMSYSYLDKELDYDQDKELRLRYRLKQIDTDGTFTYYNQVAEVNNGITDIEEESLPIEFSLSQNYPNPFNPTTTINYTIPISEFGIQNSEHVSLRIYDILGNEAATLVDQQQPAGSYQIEFNSENLSSGLYIYKLIAGSFVDSKKMLFIK